MHQKKQIDLVSKKVDKELVTERLPREKEAFFCIYLYSVFLQIRVFFRTFAKEYFPLTKYHNPQDPSLSAHAARLSHGRCKILPRPPQDFATSGANLLPPISLPVRQGAFPCYIGVSFPHRLSRKNNTLSLNKKRMSPAQAELISIRSGTVTISGDISHHSR